MIIKVDVMYVRGQPPLQESSCQDTNGQSSAHGSVICRWLSYPAKWLSCSGRVALVDRAVCSKGTIFTRCPQMVKFDVFRRVNTGGLPLNFQEIRNVMAVPEVRQFLREMAECKEFLKATGGRINDVRMGAQELCLRYLTILSCYQWENRELQHYYGLMKSMDAEILELNTCQAEVLMDIVEHFRQVMDLCYLILGERSFCKPGSRLINNSLFSSWAVVLTRYLNRETEIRNNAEAIFRQYWRELNENMTFYNAITSSTGTKRHVLEALDAVRGIVEENL